ncbi:MAG: alpha/beta fold hydrolase [Aphanocapsa sp. GSE-SYN-MK-11-07L]|jgi:pimeloyl-ACP methyl ester carboxylesterase|nr:alpha/beta fold hydrolase [Aphanocapsa sp. GSE-SYN-MK-11-07L]
MTVQPSAIPVEGLANVSDPAIFSQIWQWQGLGIRYQQAGTQGAAVLLVHGFGASSDHWRKNIAVLGQTNRVYAIDLLGFGQSAKPRPVPELAYTFETWAAQVLAFCRQVIGEPTFLVGNSIGCIVALQSAVTEPAWVRGIGILNCSLRLLHDRKRATLPWYRNVGSSLLQKALAYPAIGNYFFTRLAKPEVIRKILLQAYGHKEAVTDELIELLLKPAQDKGAVDVFLAFIRYSQGPLAEDLLPQINCPIVMLWGTDDPWEAIALGQELATCGQVEEFIPLKGVGHCPQDEAPELVNPILQTWLSRHSPN